MKKEKPKQETLEEAFRKFKLEFTILNDYNLHHLLQVARFGAKWQQQQNKNLYSEQTVTEYAYYFESCYTQRPMQKPLTPSEYFKQFKKK